MSAELVGRLIEILARVDADTTVRAVVIAGAGAGFCAGSDLDELARASHVQRSDFERESALAARRLAQCSKPVIAAVHGFAIGGGLTLATSCDIVVTDALSRWSLPEVAIGLFPAWGLGSVITRIGVARARRLSFGVDTWDGAEAVRVGLADELADNPLVTAHKMALKLAKLPHQQVTAVKRFFAEAPAFEAADGRANELFTQSTESAEGRALFESFRRKARNIQC